MESSRNSFRNRDAETVISNHQHFLIGQTVAVPMNRLPNEFTVGATEIGRQPENDLVIH
jgi:hypothetical protein